MISIGVDIGSYSLKIAQLEDGPRGYNLIGFKEYPLSQDPTKDKSIEVLDTLRNLFSQLDMSQTRIVFGEKQGRVSTRFLEFPFRERHKILKSLPFELEEDIPFSPDDAFYDAKVLKVQKNLTHVAAVANPYENVEKWYRLANDSGIAADLLSVEGFAFCNLNEAWYSSPPEFQEELPELPEAEVAELYLVVGHLSSILIVKSGGILRAIRNIDWGGKNIADTIGRKYSINYVEALKELRAKAFILTNEDGATREQVTFSNTIKSSIDELGHELRLTLLELQGQAKIEIRQGFLTGGTTLIKGFGAYLTQHLEISFNTYRYMDQISHLGLELTPEVEAKAATSIGLAIEGLKKPRNPAINLFKGEFEKKSQDLQKLWDKWKHTAQVLAATFVLLIAWGMWRESISMELADTAHATLKTQASNVAGLRGAAANSRNINKFLRDQKALEQNRGAAEKIKEINSAMDILAEVSQKVPSSRNIQLEVQRFMVENNTVQIEGLVRGNQAMAQLKRSLESVASGGKLQDVQPQVTPKSGFERFGFKLQVNRMKGS